MGTINTTYYFDIEKQTVFGNKKKRKKKLQKRPRGKLEQSENDERFTTENKTTDMKMFPIDKLLTTLQFTNQNRDSPIKSRLIKY